MGDFTHLHVHSHYSLLDGLGKIEDLCARTKALGMDSIALTDHGSMYGSLEFYQTAKAAGLRPIIGLEAYLAPAGHLQKRSRSDGDPRHSTLLAASTAGYKNLMKLTTNAHLHGFYYKPRIDYELLRDHAEGLIVLSGCLNGDIPQAILKNNQADVKRLIKWHLEVFGRDRFYFEVQHHPGLSEQQTVNQALIDLGQKYRVGLVATADSHYIHPEDNEAQDVLVCVQTGKIVTDKDRLCMLNADLSLKSPQQMKEVFKDTPAAVDNTQKIAEACHIDIQLGVNQLPHFPLPKGITSDGALRTLCQQGLQQRYGSTLPAQAHERLEYELGVIKTTGFASYFLIVADFVNEAKRRGILVGPGRGSAAGSFVSYLANITNIDPLKYDLLFERFLNPQRVNMPDIDLDFADDRRDEVIEYVRKKYGTEHVAQIITFGTMAARASVRDAGRALGFPYAFCDQIAKAIPPMTAFAEALKISEDLRQLYESDPQARRLIDMARKLEGVCRHASTHAAGVVITEKPLSEYVPLQLSNTSKGEADTVTQFAMHDVEALGLLKMDFLGLRNLTVIGNTLERIHKRHATAINLDALPLDDAATYRLLQDGTTTGVFQLESSGMKRYLRELKPTVFEDIISMVALYRPGPMDSIPNFIAGKHGTRTITYLHPVLQPILAKTYGVIVTQDQVLQIARQFSGFSYAEADILRKAVGKKIKELLDEQRDKFIQGAITTTNVSQKLAQQVWDFIEPFARYGFNRAHAACYAMIAYQTAYLKANYPAEFMAALLTSDLGDVDRAAIEVAEALALGLKILPPDMNESDHDFTVVKGDDGKEAIRFGLAAIKNVGDNVVNALMAERQTNGPYQDIADLFRRVDVKTFNRKSAESLIRAGAFDRLGERNLLLHNLERLLTFNRQLHRQNEVGQKGLFASSPDAISLPTFTLDEVAAAAKEDRLRWEKELLGMYVSEHPLSEWQDQLARVAVPLNELAAARARTQKVRVGGVTTRIKKIYTKKQQTMLFVLLEDLVGKVEVLVFPRLLESTQATWVESAAVIVEGSISDKDGELKILADKVWPLTAESLANFKARPTAEPRSQRIAIRLPSGISREQLSQLQQALADHHTAQGVAVELIVPVQGVRQRVATSYRLPEGGAPPPWLEKIVGSHAVSYH